MNTLKVAFLMSLLTVLLVFIGQYLGGQNGMIMALGFAILMNFGSYWFSDKIVLKMYRAQPVTETDQPRLHAMVRDLTIRAELPMPKVYVVPLETPNAFATGRNPKHAAVAVTSGMMRLLSENELRAVVGHELGHIKNRDMLIGTIAATFAGAISMLAYMARFAAIFGGSGRDSRGGGGLGALVIMIIAPIAAMLIQMAISRSREYLADATGARLHGNPRDLAQALKKLHSGVKRFPLRANPTKAQVTAHMFIVNPLSGRGLAGLFSTHPPMEERVTRLENMIL